jgi:hypothetical protein
LEKTVNDQSKELEAGEREKGRPFKIRGQKM